MTDSDQSEPQIDREDFEAMAEEIVDKNDSRLTREEFVEIAQSMFKFAGKVDLSPGAGGDDG